ncbi:MAG: RNA 2',3'-cyclic phosphodiesterase [Candidatus Marinimicrobia bacterium]|nr:RNA 2',3'-cyclic phosphodiesterase [Candidatus Neomarinimicrobiota bacterium]
MEPIRTFLALPLPPELKSYLKRLVTPIKNNQDKINWVKDANIHITLNYLGDTDPEIINEQALRLESMFATLPTLKLGTTDTGIYPHANEPRVLWVATAPYGDALSSLKENLDNLLGHFGYQLDKRQFQPHITVARVKSISRKSTFIHDFLAADVREINFEVAEVKWLKSTLTPMGADYEELKSFKLNTGGH